MKVKIQILIHFSQCISISETLNEGLLTERKKNKECNSKQGKKTTWIVPPKYHYNKIRRIKIINILPYVGLKYCEKTKKVPMAVAKRSGKKRVIYVVTILFYSRSNLLFIFLTAKFLI